MQHHRLSWVPLAWVILGWATAAPCATYTDAMGRQVSLDRQPQRIVTLAPNLTEIVYFLGLGDRVVGVTQYSGYPPEAADKPRVGSFVDLNVERIISLAPDLVLGTADGNPRKTVSLLERAGVPVYVLNPRSIREVIDSLVTVGRLCGVVARAAELAAGLSARIDAVVQRTAALERPLVFLQVNPRPIVTVNQNTFLHDLIRLAGGENMAQDEPMSYPRMSVEEVVRKRPDVIIISSMGQGGGSEEARQYWLRWTPIPAVRHGRVHVVDSDLIDRPSPRIVQGLERLARYLHPEVAW